MGITLTRRYASIFRGTKMLMNIEMLGDFVQVLVANIFEQHPLSIRNKPPKNAFNSALKRYYAAILMLLY